MISLEEARTYILQQLMRLEAVKKPISESSGHVSAVEVKSSVSLPPFKTTSMDGYAVYAKDTIGASEEKPVLLEKQGEVFAGIQEELRLEPRKVIKVMTGARLPLGTNAVVQVEETAMQDNQVQIFCEVSENTFIRPIGSHLNEGEVVCSENKFLNPASVGMLASVGEVTASVYRKPKIGVISTGNELVANTSPLRSGQIWDANRPALLAQLAGYGFETADLGIATDDEKKFRQTIESAAVECDVIISSGGVSMGDRDVVKNVLQPMATFQWMQLAIKPGKPFLFGMYKDTPYFGLPGNPVSALVSLQLLVLPALKKMMGYQPVFQNKITAKAGKQYRRKKDGKTHYFRSTISQEISGEWTASPRSGQQSHQLIELSESDALAVIPDGDGIEPGALLELIPLTFL